VVCADHGHRPKRVKTPEGGVVHLTSRIKPLLSSAAVTGALAIGVLSLGAPAAQALPKNTCQSTYVALELTWRSAEQSWAAAASLEDYESDAYFYDMSQSVAAGRPFNRAVEALGNC
jgi:hypothetical protein